MEEKREGSRSLSQQEEDALQSIARSDLGGLFKARMDEGFTLLYANDSYYAIHGYTRGQLEQDPDDADQYYARSSTFDDVTYDMHTTAEKDLFWWGGENDTYLRQADSQ